MSERERTEPTIGFSVSYYDRGGLHMVPVQINLHDARTPEEIGQVLYMAYHSLCQGIQPLGAPNRETRRIHAAVRRSLPDPDAA